MFQLVATKLDMLCFCKVFWNYFTNSSCDAMFSSRNAMRKSYCERLIPPCGPPYLPQEPPPSICQKKFGRRHEKTSLGACNATCCISCARKSATVFYSQKIVETKQQVSCEGQNCCSTTRNKIDSFYYVAETNFCYRDKSSYPVATLHKLLHKMFRFIFFNLWKPCISSFENAILNFCT